MMEGKIKPVADGHQKIAFDEKLLVFSVRGLSNSRVIRSGYGAWQDKAPTVQKNLLALFVAAILPVKKEVRLWILMLCRRLGT